MEFAGIFYDFGISGTSTAKREGLFTLIDQCKRGKIDYILTKSISRFSRNTTDCLTLVRGLLALNIPVYFEKENIDTENMENELILEEVAVEAINKIIRHDQEYLKVLQENIEEALNKTQSDELYKIDCQLASLEQELLERTSNHEYYDDIAAEIISLRDKRKKYIMDENSKKAFITRIEEIKELISSNANGITEFSDTLVRHLISKITIFNDYIYFEFKSGIKVKILK